MKQKIKLVSALAILAVATILLTACGGVSVKTFTRDGMTITADSGFTAHYNYKISDDPYDNTYVNIFLESAFIGITGMRGNVPYGVTNLRDYTTMVITQNPRVSNYVEVLNYNRGNTVFDYFYFNYTTQDIPASYMVVVMQGAANYYVFNFFCSEYLFSNLQTQFMNWAKLLVVE